MQAHLVLLRVIPNLGPLFIIYIVSRVVIDLLTMHGVEEDKV